MPAAIATGNLTVRPGSLVTQVLYDEQKGKATGVEIIDTETKKTETFLQRSFS
jgi:choline dehydrogenase-like flavoprotein